MRKETIKRIDALLGSVLCWLLTLHRQTRAFLDGKFEEAAQKAERLLAQAATRIVPKLLEEYSAIVWEDQDECLEVRPEDIDLT